MAISNLPPNPYARGSSSSVKSAEGKARQRERNKEAGLPHTSSGSSGAAKGISNYPHLSWEEVEEEGAEHVTDIACKISHTQVGTSGYMTAQISIPLKYAHAVLDAHLASRGGLVYLRVYGVSQEAFLKKMAEEQAATLAAEATELTPYEDL